MDPTIPPTPPTPTPATTPEPLVEFIRTRRSTAAHVCLALAAAFLILTIWLAVKGFRASAVPEKPADTAGAPELPDIKPEVINPNRGDYLVGGIGALIGFVTLATIGVWLLVGIPNPSEARQRTDIRVAVLAAGGILGTTLILAGVAYFYRWSESVTGWLDKGEAKQARWVLIPLLMVVGGAGLVFAAVQPARGEERNNPVIRRLVYGSNFALTAMLLFVLLVVVNVFIGLRLPNKLDTTSTGFYSLSPATEQALGTLDQPITAYAILQEGGNLANDDMRRLLQSCQDANPGKFRAVFYSPVLNKKDVEKLRNEYPQAELSREGVLLTAGEDKKRHSFIRDDEFSTSEPGGDGRPKEAFSGEARLLREILFLGESKQRPVVYFTQSSRELAITTGDDRVPPRRSASALKAYLDKNYVDVRPLAFDVAAAKIPDDAAVVVIADPLAPLPDVGVEAIRKYMTEPRPDGKKGKLLVLAGAEAGADKRLLKLGIEPLLESFQIRIPDRFLYTQPTRELAANLFLGMITETAAAANNPVALGFNKVNQLPLFDCREVAAVRSAPGAPGGFQAIPVLATSPGRITWLEPERAGDPEQALDDLLGRMQKLEQSRQMDALQKMLAEYQPSRSPRQLAVFVSEGTTARVAVFGCGWFVSDDASQKSARLAQSGTLWLDLIGSTLDWLRDRPAVTGVTNKTYTSYTMAAAPDTVRLIWLPLLLSLLLVASLGAGVWVIRRK